MGLVTDDLADWLAEPPAKPGENPSGACFAQSMEASPHTRWHHAVQRLRKWLRTVLPHHGEHEDGLTR